MIMKVFEERRSVRRYKDQPVEEEKLQAVLEAARSAPSWANMQCWYYIVVKDPATRSTIAEILEKNPISKGITQAPVLIVACADPEQSGKMGDQSYYLVDIGISLEHLMLEACNQGLGTCWVAWLDEEKLKQVLEVPDNIRIVALTPLGYPDQPPTERRRKPLEEIVFHEKWGQR